MKLTITPIISDFLDSLDMINSISSNINSYLETRDYGDGLATIHIGIICVNPVYDDFYKPKRHRFDKKNKALTIEFKFEFNIFSKLSIEERKKLILNELIKIPEVVVEKKIKGFDIKDFILDISHVINSLLTQGIQ